MGQGWRVLNVDRREKDLVDWGKLGEFFFSDLSALYRALHLPCLPKEVDKWLSSGTFSIQPKPIGALPTEVLDLIFEAILDDTKRHPTKKFLTCVFLSLTCKRLLSIGKRYILRSLTSRYARAADCRIICLGGCAGKDDQPPGMLSDAEIKEIETTRTPYEDGDLPNEEYLMERCLGTFASELYTSYNDARASEYLPIYLLLGSIDRTREKLRKAPAPNAARLRDLDMITKLACQSKPTYPDGPNVLCNLSKGECVREDALVKLESECGRVTLAQALLSRICYSPDPSMAMPCSEEYEERLSKGPWAGDRCRITSVADMPPLKVGREWRDVTKEVNEMLLHLWQDEVSDDEDEGVSDSESEEVSGDDDEGGEKLSTASTSELSSPA